MINTDMREYDYFTLGAQDAYGQDVLPKEGDTPTGKIKMAINISSQAISENINYLNCNYIGLTQAKVDDTYIVVYGNERLKVLYVNPKGRYTQVFMSRL